mgnify:CR=1 FL=1
MPAGTLFIVATPIGNLGDLTPRALETLKGVAAICAEDTRRSGQLMSHFGISTPLLALHAIRLGLRGALLGLALQAAIATIATLAGQGPLAQFSQPTLALAQAGYRNRFGHPSGVVTARYDERGINWVASPQCGAATWRSMHPEGVDCHRLSHQRYWHRR